MTPQELKNGILQLAIQGKLVEQRPEEGTAEELYRRIQAEKGSKGSKRLKDLAASVADPVSEPPFEIPESWRWCRLGDCTNYAGSKEKILPGDIAPETWSLDLEDIEKETGKVINRRFARDRRITGEKVVFRKGEILYSKLRPYLKKILVVPEDGICSPELVPFSAHDGIDADYLVVVLKSPAIDFAINSASYGVKMPRVGTETMTNLRIPLPPLAEQRRIVAKIEELLPLVDRYERAWSKLEDFNKRFPGDMQKSLLQMAIQGKLVEQRPEEGTGEELLKSILAAKASKGSKRSKDSADVPVSDPPFEIPESWVWVRLDEILMTKPANGLSPKSVDYPTRYRNLTLTATTSGFFKSDAFKYVEISEEVAEKYYLENDDILIQRSNSRELVGTSCIYRCGNKQFIYPDLMMRLHLIAGIDVDFVDCVLKSPFCRSYYQKAASGTSESMPKINQSIVRNTLLPLPPLAEQKRIVAKLEELLPLCERLKKNPET